MDKSVLNKIVACALILSMAGCSLKSKQDGQDMIAETAPTVEVTPLKIQTIARKINLSTTLQGYEIINISPSLTGNIERIYVEIGSRVKKGDTLVRMDQNQYNTTKLALANLQTEYNRIKELYETSTVSKQSYDQAKLNYEQTKESLSFLTENTFVKARIPGVISAKNYEEGELFSGTPILTLTQINQLKANISIPETYFPLVKQGMNLELYSDIYPGQVFPATIEFVYPTVNEATHNFQVRLKIPNQKELLRPGMFVRTTVELGEFESLMAPYQAVLRLTGSNERYVFINENGVAKRVSVALGQRYNEMVEIISNELKTGDQLVTLGQEKLVDGAKLEVVQ